MIRPIDINLNAAHPELPLVEATTFTGAPSSVFISGAPKNVGNWSITAVNVAVTYPDNTTTARAAVESAEGVWVATIPGTATSGRTTAGFRILADGIDENGAAVTGYVLGFADFSVFSFLPVPAPGETYYLLRYFDAMPTTPKKGDVAVVGGVLKYYNGTTWLPFADLTNYYDKDAVDDLLDDKQDKLTFDNAPTSGSNNPVKSGGIWSALWGALSALPTGFTSLYDWCVDQLAGKEPLFQASTASGTTIKTVAAIVKDGSLLKPIDIPTSGMTINGKSLLSDVTLTGADIPVSGTDATKINAALASKQPKIAASGILKGDGAGGVSAAAAGTDYQAPLSQTQLNNIAAVPNKANASDLRYSYNTATVSSGTTATVTDVADRAINTATLGSSVTAATVTLPTATANRARDFFIDLTIEATTAPTLTFIDPATNTTANVAFGADSLADIDTGKNAVLFTEFPNYTWIVSVKHEEVSA